MGKDYHKVKAYLNATIHHLTLGTNIFDPFQIEWKRGETRGITEQALDTGNKVVSFEKNIQCPCTLYLGKKGNEKKPKYFQITVNVFKSGNKKKVYGKLVIDISEFYGISSPITKDYQIDSAHKDPTFLRFSAILTNNMSEPPSSDSLTSIADNLESDKPDEWDLSFAVDEEEQIRINEFFSQRRDEKQKLATALSDFHTKVASNPRPSPRNRMKAPSLQTGLPTTPPSSLEAFFSAPKSTKSRKKKLKDSRSLQFLTPPSLISTESSSNAAFSSADEPLSSSHSFSHSKLDMHSRDEIPIDSVLENQDLSLNDQYLNANSNKEEVVPEVDPFEAATEFLKTIAMKHWMTSPVTPTVVPLSSAALFSGLIESGLFDTQKFDNEQFSLLIQEFITRISGINVVDKGTQFDNLCVMLSLLHIISSNTTIDTNRRDVLAKEFAKSIVRPLFSQYIDDISTDLQTAAMSIIMGTVDNDSAIKLILNSIDNVLRKNFILDETAAAIQHQDGTILNVQKNFRESVKNMLVDKFDLYFIANILQNDFQVRFGNAANWNQIMINLRDEQELNFSLFREAISILMVAQGLCQTPELIPDIAPSLSPELILKLMEVEVPDELMPLRNDTATFAEYYKLPQMKPVEDVLVNVKKDYQGDFSEILGDLPNNWESAKFDEETISQFPFLKSYFN